MLLASRLAATDWGSPHGVTEQSKQALRMWQLTYYIAIPLCAIVVGLILWCVVRYRHRGGSDRKPAQFQYNVPLEILYTVVPIILVAIVFAVLFGAEDKEDAVSKHPALVVQVQGFQWGWRFTYPNGHQQVGSFAGEQDINNTSNLPILYLPAHETVQLNLRTADVNHSFYVPEFLFKRDLIAGVKNNVDFTVDKTGKWIGECTQLCGTYHAYMRFMVNVMPPDQFNSWMASQAPGSITQAGGA